MDLSHASAWPVDRMLQEAAQRDQAQRLLQQALRMTLQNPQRVTTLNVSLTGLRKDGDTHVLMVALPSGERIDIPMKPQGIAELSEASVKLDAQDVFKEAA